MSVVGLRSASSRRAMVMWGVVMAFCAASVVSAQEPAPEAAAPAPEAAPQAAEPAEPDPFLFTSPAAMVMFTVKAASVPDFESVWASIRSKASMATDKPALKAQLETLTIYKVAEPGAGQAVTYFFQIDPVDRTSSYSPTELLFSSELFEREEALQLFDTLNNSLEGINTVALRKVP